MWESYLVEWLIVDSMCDSSASLVFGLLGPWLCCVSSSCSCCKVSYMASFYMRSWRSGWRRVGGLLCCGWSCVGWSFRSSW